jgi:carbamoyl-phosphate synthase large subunit
MYTILVTGVGGPAGMAAIQSLRLAPEKIQIVGVDMDAMAPGLFISDFKVVVPACDSHRYIPTLLDVCSKWKVDAIIPTVDEEVSVLARYASKFRARGIRLPIPNGNDVDLARDKLRIASFSKFGLDTPRTLGFKSASELPDMISELGLPCVLKQRVGRGGRGFAVIDTAADARYWRKKRGKDELVLQEKVDGDLLLVQGIAKKGKVIVHIVHKRLAVKAPGSGTAIAAVTVLDETASEHLRRVVRVLKWEGAIGVEFVHDPKAEKYYLIDVNPRICGQSHLSTMAGMNLAYGLVQFAMGRKVTIGPSYRPDVAFIRTWKDEAVALGSLPPIWRLARG